MPNYNTTVRNARMTVVRDAANGGKLSLYSGTKPAAGGPITTLLADFDLASPSGSVTGGVLTFTDPSNTTVVASGQATWARITDSGNAWVADFTCSQVGGDGEIRLTEDNLTTGMILDITSLTITEGDA